MYKLGLTGGIATGKSTVSAYLREQGYPVIDADQVAHDVLNHDEGVLTALKTTFGSEIFVEGHLSRPALGQRVFGHPTELAKLNAIAHPVIFQQIDDLATQLMTTGVSLIVYDIPLLLETPSKVDFDGIMVVTTSPAKQLERLMARNKLSEAEAQKRIASQMPIADKVQLADFVIDNNGSEAATFAQVEEVLHALHIK